MPPADAPQLVVLDASVAVRWVVEEEGSAEAAELLTRDLTWVAPRLLLTEVASALRRKVADDAPRRPLPVSRSTLCSRQSPMVLSGSWKMKG